MPTPNGPQFEQLKMFMKPSEINPDESVDAAAYWPSTMDELWQRKLEAGQGSGLEDSVRREGVKTPVQLIHDPRTGKTTMGHGHHRVAVAKNLESVEGKELYVPVLHSEMVYKNDFDWGGDVPSQSATLRDYENHMSKHYGYGVGYLD
jgi:hypothetical protein